MIALPARAQVFSDAPLCLKIHNTIDHEVLGHIETAEYYDDAGKLSWHRSNFRIKEDETKEVCSTGPFFDGYKLRIVIKTLMPLYSCKTEMNRTVTLSNQTDENGITLPVADCPSEMLNTGR